MSGKQQQVSIAVGLLDRLARYADALSCAEEAAPQKLRERAAQDANAGRAALRMSPATDRPEGSKFMTTISRYTPETLSELHHRTQDLIDGQVTWGRWLYEGGEVRAVPTEPHPDDVDGQSELVAQVMAMPRGDGELIAAAPTLARECTDLSSFAADQCARIDEMQQAIRALLDVDARHRAFLQSAEGQASSDSGFARFAPEFDAAYGRLHALAGGPQ